MYIIHPIKCKIQNTGKKTFLKYIQKISLFDYSSLPPIFTVFIFIYLYLASIKCMAFI